MLADYYTIQDIYHTVAVDILPYPASSTSFAKVLGNQDQVKDIDRSIHVNIPCCIYRSRGYGDIFKSN